uniref:Uncharacterized protein n=1 Tax=Caenorhabditis japonica TaxID=281687 RepID=A0A8R1EVP4_CAEJA
MNFFCLFSTTITIIMLFVSPATCQWYSGGGLDNYPLYFGHQSGNSNGNSYVGNELAGVYLLCNGIGCPGRGR